MEDWEKGVTMDMLPEAHRKIAEVIGVESTMSLCQVFGGATLYVPMNDTVYKEVVRNKAIRARYLRGAKISQLSASYGLSEQSIIRIVRDIRPNQISMFD